MDPAKIFYRRDCPAEGLPGGAVKPSYDPTSLSVLASKGAIGFFNAAITSANPDGPLGGHARISWGERTVGSPRERTTGRVEPSVQTKPYKAPRRRTSPEETMAQLAADNPIIAGLMVSPKDRESVYGGAPEDKTPAEISQAALAAITSNAPCKLGAEEIWHLQNLAPDLDITLPAEPN